jgi:hypothetical protein
LNQKIALGAALLALGLTVSTASLAQPVLPFYRALAPELSPQQIVAIARASGLDPVSRPVRRGRAYTLRALDASGREVQVDIHARRGRILDVAPVAERRYADIPPPGGRPPGLVPDGYDPDELSAAPGRAEADNPPAAAPGPPAERSAPGRGIAVSPPALPSAAPPPLPRPRPRVAATHSPPPDPTPPAAPPPSSAAEAKDQTGAVATSAGPAWHAIEQQE